MNQELKKQNNFHPKKFLFVSYESLSGDVAWHVKKEGHDVKVYIESKVDADVYNGFLEKVANWKDYIDWADVIVFDDIGFGKIADSLRKDGKLVVGGSKYTDLLEENREFGQDELKNTGVSILDNFNFTNFEDAIKFLKENPGRYVFKPNGYFDSTQEILLYIGEDEDGHDILETLDRNKVAWSKKIKSFQLQKFAPGVEIAVGTFFNGQDFIYPININFEHKRLFPGDIGPLTGEMGTLMYWSSPNIIFNRTLLNMKEKLAKAGYVGYVDINCIANARGVYPLEFTCRFGYPTISIQMEGIQTPIGEFLFRLANHETFELKTKKGFQIGTVIAVPSFLEDNSIPNSYKDFTIHFKKNTFDGVHLGDVKTSNRSWYIAGESGYVLVVTGSGSTVDEARKQCYRRIKNIVIKDMFYRTDIGVKWYKESDLLQTWGYL